MRWLKRIGLVVAAFVVLLVLIAIFAPTPPRATATGTPAAAAIAPATPPSGVTMANYTRLQTGMSYDAAVEILGDRGEEMSRTELAGTTSVMYMWKGRSVGANMNAMFQNDRLVSKAQFGLR